MAPRKPKPGCSLGDLYPELITEWSPKNSLTPFDYSSKSNEKVLWVCSQGHGAWLASVQNRTRGRGCKKCGYNKISKNKRTPEYHHSLGDIYPELASLWSPNNKLTPFDYKPKSNDKVWWVCEKHGDYKQLITSKAGGYGCPTCGKLKAGVSRSKPVYKKSLAYLFPELAKEWSPLNKTSPSQVYPKSAKKYYWICPNGHEDYEANCLSKTSRGSSCPTCSHKGIPPLNESLGFKRADLIFEWSKENEKSIWEVWPSSNTKVKWECSRCGYVDMTSVSFRFEGHKCRYCTHQLPIAPKEHSLGFIYPELLGEWSPKNDKSPFDIYAGSGYKAKWVCSKCDYEWRTTISHRTSGDKTGCPACSNHTKYPNKGKSLAEKYPSLVPEWSPSNDLTPYEVYPGSEYKAKWICPKGHEWEAYCYSRSGPRSTGCPMCNNGVESKICSNLIEQLEPFGVSSTGYLREDIYLPAYNTIVEYDGSYWHLPEKKVNYDVHKTMKIIDDGFRVIRVRESTPQYHLPSLDKLINSVNYFEIPYFIPNGHGRYVDTWVTNLIVSKIKEKTWQKKQ